MRIHRTTSEAVIYALGEIFAEGRYADKVIEKVLKQNSKPGKEGELALIKAYREVDSF